MIDFLKNFAYPFPTEFTVKVLAEDEEPMVTAKTTCITMRIWKTDGPTGKATGKVISYQPDSRRKNDQDGVFYFS